MGREGREEGGRKEEGREGRREGGPEEGGREGGKEKRSHQDHPSIVVCTVLYSAVEYFCALIHKYIVICIYVWSEVSIYHA